MTATNSQIPVTWPDRTGLPHAAKVAALKALPRAMQVLTTDETREAARRAASKLIAAGKAAME